MRRVCGTLPGALGRMSAATVVSMPTLLMEHSWSSGRPCLNENLATVQAMRQQIRFQSTSASAKNATSQTLSPTASPNTSYAMMTLVGVVHDIQMGSVGDDNIFQFQLTCNTMVPAEAEQKYLEKLKQEEAQPESKGSSPRGTIRTSNKSEARSDMAVIEEEKQYAMARQAHLLSSKEQFTVRCYGGEPELTAIQMSVVMGSLVRVAGHLRLNLQRDITARRVNAQSVSIGPERSFPYVRVELGDAIGLQQVKSKGVTPHMLRSGSTNMLVASGSVSIISKPRL